MWTGVQVWGNAAKPQYAENGHYWQGRLEMVKGATIANALVGVDVWKPGDGNTTGGVVIATDSHFTNNTTAVHFPPYMYHFSTQELPNNQFYMDNVSFFSNCDFTVNSSYIGSESFERHVDLYKVKGIEFRGCDFVLSSTPCETCISGIFAHDAGFSLKGITLSGGSPSNPIPVIDKSTFTGFNKAVVSLSDGSVGVYPVTVSSTDFTNNDFGLYAVRSGFTSVHNSTFSLGRNTTADCAVGIFAEETPNFSIELDTFGLAAQHPLDTYGVLIKDSRSQNIIQYNVFSGLFCANFSEGNNNTAALPPIGSGTRPTVLGLEYRCNENSGNQCDFFVKGGINPAQLGIQPEQGAPRCAANNTFSQGQNAFHFLNYGNNIIHYYYDPSLTNGTPSNNYGVTLVQTTDTLGCDPNTSPSGGTEALIGFPLTDGQRSQLESDYAEAYSAYSAVKALYDQRIDGGDTRAEIAGIQSATTADMWTLRAKLLGDSPYLSFEALRNTADRDDILPQSVIFEILSSNPDELRNDTLLSYLRSKDDPLPEYMIAILQQVANGVTARTAMEAQMARYSQLYRQAAGDIVRGILNDTVVDKADLVRWLGNMRDMETDHQIVGIYLEDGDLEGAEALAEMLPSLYGLTGRELEEHESYMDMLGLYMNLHRDGRNTLQLDSAEMAMVERVMDEGKGTASAMAKAVMMGYGYRTDDCPACMTLPGGGGRGMETDIPAGDYNTAMGFCVELSPNPANTWAAVDYSLPAGMTEARLSITNTLGTVILECGLSGGASQKILDLRGLGAGVYTYTVSCGKLVKSGKLVIVK